MQLLWRSIFTVLFLATVGSCADDVETTGSEFPNGDVRRCPTTSPIFPKEPLYRMEVLPGAGFDALRSLDMGQVHVYNYSKCRVSNDGRYLLPDSIFLIPTMKSHVQVFAEYIDHYDNYTSTTSTSITLEAGFESIVSGKFSDEYLSVKTHMVNDLSIATRVQLRNVLFKVKIQPDAELHPAFRSRLFEIAANIQNNNTEFAHYLAELTVREYGTHFVTNMDAGAVLSQVDFLTSKDEEDSDFTKKTITASASANFLGKFQFSASFEHSTTTNQTQKFIDNRTYSEVFSWGGPPFGINMTINEWEEGIPNAMVAVDRSGDPLHYAITPTSLPEMPEGTVYEVAHYILRAITRYYKVNTRYGCTEINSPNFDFQANVNDNSCKPPSTNFTFGGIYQTCQYVTNQYEDLCNAGPQPVQQVNPLTGDTSCSEPYIAVLLHSGQVSHTVRRQVCEKHCSWWSCHNNCYLQPYTTVVHYEAYWCVALEQTEPNSGYLFGGYYTSTVANPFLGTKSCPRYYMPLHFGEDMYICVSDDYELGYSYSIPFAGFESCTTGNPLAVKNPSPENQGSWPHDCPVGFSQHLVAVDENCEINFCIKSGAFNEQQAQPPRLPPFRKRKQMNPNATDTLVVIGNFGELWYKNEDGDWVKDPGTDAQNGKVWVTGFVNVDPAPSPLPSPLPSPGPSESASVDGSSSSSSSSSSGLSNGAVAGISVASTFVLCTLIAVVFFAGYSIRNKRAKGLERQDEETYLTITEENTSQPSYQCINSSSPTPQESNA